jgi:hypothetical protein
MRRQSCVVSATTPGIFSQVSSPSSGSPRDESEAVISRQPQTDIPLTPRQKLQEHSSPASKQFDRRRFLAKWLTNFYVWMDLLGLTGLATDQHRGSYLNAASESQ